jgi:hypothetical protein
MYSRLAQALASSFNFQGRVRKTFYVLSDDKVVAGVRRPLQQSKASQPSTETDTEANQPMETDSSEATTAPNVPPQPPTGTPTLAAKLSANLANKRKATEHPEQSGPSDKPKRR